jgi:predicted nucleotide-binding protein
MATAIQKANGADPTSSKKRRVDSDFPKKSLEDALRVPKALEKNGGQPMPPIDVAMAMDLSPGSSLFRDLASASMKYGLTKGTWRAANIELTPLGESVITPKGPEELAQALLGAALGAATFSEIYAFYRGKKFPESQFFINTVVREFGVPQSHANACEEVFRANMEFVGLLKETNGGVWLSSEPPTMRALPSAESRAAESNEPAPQTKEIVESAELPAPDVAPADTSPETNRVFITHGKNSKIVNQVKELLVYGKFEPVVSVEKHTVSKPVPEKVLDEMRGCSAAVIHVGADQVLIDDKGEQHSVLNPNVLIEIGAAMALYGRNFILLVEHGTELPSNLQGLYEVRYEGDGLDHEATMRLLKSFNDFQK